MFEIPLNTSILLIISFIQLPHYLNYPHELLLKPDLLLPPQRHLPLLSLLLRIKLSKLKVHSLGLTQNLLLPFSQQVQSLLMERVLLVVRLEVFAGEGGEVELAAVDSGGVGLAFAEGGRLVPSFHEAGEATHLALLHLNYIE